jgi:4-amino-4-deoxy-L-arabinose transferase-like glycosyltransferase
VGLALAAQCVFTGQPFKLPVSNTWSPTLRDNVGIGLLLAAIACFAGATLESGSTESERDRSAGIRSIASVLRAARITDWIGPVLAASCYLASLGLYLAVGENLGVQLLWLAGIVILLISQHPILAIRSDPMQIKWWEWWMVTAVTAVGFGLRYWHLTEIPSHVDNDVALMGWYSLRLIQTGQTNWFGMLASDHSLVEHQLLAWSMRLFGENHYGVVMKSVIAGTLTLPVVYLLGREMFNRRVGLIAMVLLTISYTHIHFSRILFTPVPTLIVTLLMYFVFRGLRTRRGLWFVLAGVMLGLGLLVYYSGRIGPVIVLTLLAGALLWKRQTILANLGNWAILALGSFLTFGPMLAYGIINFHSYVGRGNTVALFNPVVMSHEMYTYGVGTVSQVLIEQVKHTFLTFHLYGDGSPHFAYVGPMVSPLTAALLVLGFGLSLVRLRSLKYFALVAWVIMTLILGGVLTADPPYWPHLGVLLPAVALIAALAADKILDELSLSRRQLWNWGLHLVLAVALLLTGIRNWLVYTDFVRDNAQPRIRIARYINSLPSGYQVRLVSDDWPWSEYAFRFLNRDVPGLSVSADQLQTKPLPLEGPTVFILFNHPELVPILQQYYPSGEVQEHLDNEKHVAFVSYNVVPAGYVFLPALTPPTSLSDLPGWWLLSGVLVEWGLVLFMMWRDRKPAA